VCVCASERASEKAKTSDLRMMDDDASFEASDAAWRFASVLVCSPPTVSLDGTELV
jgi:hypothetical protein